MKKLAILICALFLWSGLSGIAAATIWTDAVSLDVLLSDIGSHSWTHALPGVDFSAPTDTVNSASLAIVARRAVDSNDDVYYYVDLENILLGSLFAGNGNSEATTTFDLDALFSSSDWAAAGDLLNFRLDYSQGPGSNNQLRLVSSLFTLDYTSLGSGLDDNNNADPAPVPEPGTIILLGSGLLGLIYARRKSSRK